MKNFGLSELYLVDPPDLSRESEAYGFAGHAREDVLPNAEEVEFDYLVEHFHTVGCTAITNEDETRHVRWPFRTPVELRESLRGVDSDTCLVFGREHIGLTNEELSRVDEVCSIPASADYPVLNLGQAATITMYELRELTVGETQLPEAVHERASENEIEGLYEQFERYLVALNHPAEKRPKAVRLFRRVMGRAHPTGREVSTLRGLFRKTASLLENPDRLERD
jgi:tRNA (cytidine32/uridine32-2'-O)-methyltransferase